MCTGAGSTVADPLMPESVPFWFAITVIAYLGYKLAHPPLWLVIVLLIAGFLLALSSGATLCATVTF